MSAKIDLKFLDYSDDCWISCFANSEYDPDEKIIELKVYNQYTLDITTIYLDKSTAIKFAKTLRTEINKIK